MFGSRGESIMKIQFILKETIKTNQDFVNFVITATKEFRNKSGKSIQEILNIYDALVLGAAEVFPEDQRDKAIHWITDGIMDGNINPEEYSSKAIPSTVPGQSNGTIKSVLKSVLEGFVKYWPKFDSNESKDILDYKNCKEIMSVTTPYLFDELGIIQSDTQQSSNKVHSVDKNQRLDAISKFGFSEDELRKLNESVEEPTMIMKAAAPFEGQEKQKVMNWIHNGIQAGRITPQEWCALPNPNATPGDPNGFMQSKLKSILIFFAKHSSKFKPNESRDINDYNNIHELLIVLLPYILEEYGMTVPMQQPEEQPQEPNKVHNVDKNHSLDVFKKFGFSEDEINKLSID